MAFPTYRVMPHPAAVPLPSTHGMVDFSEDVSSKDIARRGRGGVRLHRAASSGSRRRRWDRPRGSWRRSTSSPCSPRPTGQTIEETGTTVWRPPYAPITLGALAGRGFEPVRYSPMQPWHEAHGARPLVAGDWIRPDHYGDPAAEVRNVRANVGIIDVTPLGKLDLRGPDVAEAAQPALRQPVEQARRRRRPLRRDVRRGRRHPRRRRDRPARPRALRDVDHVVRCGDRLGVGPELVADGTSRVARPRHPGDDRIRRR